MRALWIECFAPLEITTWAGIGRQAVLARVERRQSLAKLGNPRRRRVVGLARPDRLERGLLNVRRRVEVGFTQREIEDLDALRFQTPGLGPHRQRGRRSDQSRTLCQC